MKPIDKSKAARKALEAYERAVAAAERVIADGPPRGLGTTVMVEKGRHRPYERVDYVCSECTNRVTDKEWRFCAHCGAEIIRWQDNAVLQPGERYTITLEQTHRA